MYYSAYHVPHFTPKPLNSFAHFLHNHDDKYPHGWDSSPVQYNLGSRRMQ